MAKNLVKKVNKERASKQKDKPAKAPLNGKVRATALIALVLVIALLGGAGYATWLFMGGGLNSSVAAIDNAPLKVAMNDRYLIGDENFDTFDAMETFGFTERLKYDPATDGVPTFSVVSGAVTMIDSHTFLPTGGAFSIAYNGKVDGEVNSGTAVFTEKDDSINVYTYEEFVEAIEEQITVVLMRNIDLGGYDPDGEGVYKPLEVYSDIYGNGHIIYTFGAYGPIRPWIHDSQAFKVVGEDVLIQELHCIGMRAKEEFENAGLTYNEKEGLSNLEKSGRMWELSAGKDDVFGATFKYCVLESSHILIRIEHANVKINGCLIRNASDACISIGTNGNGTSNVEFENVAMGAAVVADICMYMLYADVKDKDMVTMTFKGFFDCYNWKLDKGVKLVPGTEDLADTVNPLIAGNITGKQFDKYVHKYNKERYMNLGIIVISSVTQLSQGVAKKNEPKFNGLKEANLEKRDLFAMIGGVLGGTAQMFITNCYVVGYTDKSAKGADGTIQSRGQRLEPDDAFNTNPNLYKELREGRVVKGK